MLWGGGSLGAEFHPAHAPASAPDATRRPMFVGFGRSSTFFTICIAEPFFGFSRRGGSRGGEHKVLVEAVLQAQKFLFATDMDSATATHRQASVHLAPLQFDPRVLAAAAEVNQHFPLLRMQLLLSVAQREDIYRVYNQNIVPSRTRAYVVESFLQELERSCPTRSRPHVDVHHTIAA